jgi:hypothetical protein
MVDRMREIGLDAALQPVVGERVNAIGYLKGTGGGKSLLFNGHMDTNPATEGWTVDPWGGLVDDKFIYGIGVSNMKAGDAAYFCAVKTLLDAGVKLKGDVVLTYVVGELQGGVGTVAAIAQGVKADYFINAEPTDLQALTMHACAFTYVIELTGNTRHLSKREEAVDAIVAACDLIPRLNALKFSGALSDEHRSINRLHVGIVHGGAGPRTARMASPQVADFARIKRAGPLRAGPDRGRRRRRHPPRTRRARGALRRPEGDDPHRKAGRPPLDACIRGGEGRAHRQDDQCRVPRRARPAAAHRRHHAARLLRHRRGTLLRRARDGRHRLRPGRALPAPCPTSTRRHRRLPRHDRICMLCILDICEEA